MKKKILIGLVVSMAVFGYFYLTKHEERIKKNIKIYKTEEITQSDSNRSVIKNKRVNQKPTVEAGDDQNITFGNEVTLEAIARDKDGEIISYLWREGNQTLSEEESFDYTFEKGVHHLQVIVTDNDGAEAEDNVTVNVGVWVLDKITIKNKIGICGLFDGIITYEYNQDGKIIKTLMDSDRDGVANRVYYYGYDEKGRDIFTASDFNNNGIIDRNTSQTFYENDNVKESTHIDFYRENGKPYRIIKNEYTKNGKELRKTIILGQEEDNINDEGTSIKEYHYNENNQLSEIVAIFNGQSYVEKEYHYNDNKQLLEVISVENGKKRIDEKYHYKDEKLLSKESFNQNILESKESYIYEEEVLRKREYFRYKDRNISNKTSNHYNPEGLLEASIDTSGAKTKYLYDENARLIEVESIIDKHYNFYDKDGQKTRKELYLKNNEGEFEKYSYTLYNKDERETVYLEDGTRIINDDSKSKRHIGRVTIQQRRDVYDDHKNLIEIWDDATGKLIEKRVYRFIVL
jgi:YD repeat-containing protein